MCCVFSVVLRQTRSEAGYFLSGATAMVLATAIWGNLGVEFVKLAGICISSAGGGYPW